MEEKRIKRDDNRQEKRRREGEEEEEEEEEVKVKVKEEEEEEEDDDDDFMSDRFINPQTTEISKSRTYSELRRMRLIESEQRKRQNQKRSRFETEQEARELGLNRSLIDIKEFEMIKGKLESEDQRRLTDSSNGSGIVREDDLIRLSQSQQVDNKALRMMIRMGFRPDQTLGSTNQQSEHNQTTNSLPIKLNIKSDRSGIGVIDKKSKTLPSGKSFTPGGDDDCGCGEDDQRILSSFIDLQQDRYDELKSKRLISKAISTCLELDERRLKTNDQTRKHDEEEEEEEEEKKKNSKDEDEDDFQLDFWSSFLKSDLYRSSRPLLRQSERSEDEVVTGGSSTGLEVDEEDESEMRIEDRSDWKRVDLGHRLSFSLNYLRKKYLYCIWCGCQYESTKELKEFCPGQNESDH